MNIVNFNEEITKVANELYERSGRVGGRDLANWFEAERTVKARYRQKETLEAEKPAPPKRASTTKKGTKKAVAIAKKTKA
jgi:hypothetical protein